MIKLRTLLRVSRMRLDDARSPEATADAAIVAYSYVLRGLDGVSINTARHAGDYIIGIRAPRGRKIGLGKIEKHGRHLSLHTAVAIPAARIAQYLVDDILGANIGPADNADAHPRFSRIVITGWGYAGELAQAVAAILDDIDMGTPVRAVVFGARRTSDDDRTEYVHDDQDADTHDDGPPEKTRHIHGHGRHDPDDYIDGMADTDEY